MNDLNLFNNGIIQCFMFYLFCREENILTDFNFLSFATKNLKVNRDHYASWMIHLGGMKSERGRDRRLKSWLNLWSKTKGEREGRSMFAADLDSSPIVVHQSFKYGGKKWKGEKLCCREK
ncbi:hypothetical protein CsSME_00053944 [Camellia sinensis var. sinensis]|uniref:Uncharacterized protein n=1 Tax=Camellia sinensis TaxID=4442 RepID=A0A7J7FV08_CAMSI|nr:hypothetical protein HYC85_028128 [Camellia sinensis]